MILKLTKNFPINLEIIKPFKVVGDNRNDDREKISGIVSRSASSAGSKRIDVKEEVNDGVQEEDNNGIDQGADNGDDHVSNDYDTDVPITNLGVNNSSNTQSIASNLQGIAT